MAIDNVLDTARRVQYVAAAAQEDFDYAFSIFDEDDLVVDVDGVVKTISTHYTVSGVGEDAGGTVSFVTPMTGDEIVTIYSDTEIARTSDLQQNGPLASSTLNDELDKLFVIAQELKAKIGRALRLPFNSEADDEDIELSPTSSWLGKLLRFNSVSGVPEPVAIADLSGEALSAELIGDVLYPRTAAEITAGVTPTNTGYPSLNVLRYGTNTTPGTTDMLAAFDAAWDVVQVDGGTIIIPPGTYRLSNTWTCTVVNPVNWKIEGRGAELVVPTSGIAGPALRVSGSYLEWTGDIEGLDFNHDGNNTIHGCIQVLGGHCVSIKRCTTVKRAALKSDYYFVSFDSSRPGEADENDYNSFWCAVEECTTRKLNGSVAGDIPYGIKAKGSVNALTIRKNTLSNCGYGVYAEPASSFGSYALPNGVSVQDNAFETITTAAIHVQMTPSELGLTGWRIAFNRVESTTTFFSLATGGAAANPHANPPLLLGNYCSADITNWILNPTSYPVSAIESMMPGFGPVVNNQLWQNGNMTFRFDTGKDLYLLNASGSFGYATGKIFFGPDYNVRVGESDGKVYVTSGQPANATDGTVVGTQS